MIQDEREGLPSASAWERVHYCPGSRALIASIPPEQLPQSDTEEAASGTRIHAALETGDGSELDMTEGEVKERLEVLRVEAVNRWGDEKRERNPAVVFKAEEHQFIKEERIWVIDGELNKITSAKLDYACFHTGLKCGLVIDFKSGYKPTTAAQRNLQMKVQAVALAMEYGLEEVRVVIAQHRFTSMVTAADYGREDLDRAYQEILYDDWKSKQPDAQRVPGSWCQYCPAKAWCPEQGVFALVPSRNLVGSADKALLAAYVESLSPQDLAFIERRRKLAVGLFEAVKSRLKKLPADELKSLGYELDKGKPQSAVVDFSGLVEHLNTLLEKRLLQIEEYNGLFEFVNGRLEAAVIPRMVEEAANRRQKLTQKEAKALLRIELSKFINWEATRTEPSLKEIA